MIRALKALFGRESEGTVEPVIVVSGLPRSGTSMMMKMLEAGGLDVVIDGIRSADVDNPKGYYELERVKKLREGDRAWVPEVRGRVVKVISELLKWLPAEESYRIVFMNRDMDEVLRSQKKMLAHRAEEADASADAELAQLFEAHLAEIEQWVAEQPNMDIVYVHYSDLLADPTVPLGLVNTFLGGILDVDAMAAIVDPALYRSTG